MKDRLSPILFTLIILAIVFGAWFAGNRQGWFIRKTSDDFKVSFNKNDTVICIQCKIPGYGITGWSTSRYNDNILHIDLNVSRDYRNDMTFKIDTVNVQYLELYGKMYPVKELPACQ
ncbi:MAG: hypothetical protein ACK5KN_15180 [Dysgonomonas sp.]|uniref:hypothetical protein n=1 Tax=Dysgonomonas sp. TaxID=1891233 RepID=UPI003A88B49A